jgi:hypothetical protein
MAMIKKKGMGKPMKKAQKGGIISESGDLADALNEYEAMKKKGTVPKTDAEARKYMDGLNKRGMLGTPGLPKKPSKKVVAKPKKKMGGTVKKAQFGMASVKAGVDDNPNPTAADRIVLAKKNAGKAKNGASIKKAQLGATMTSAPMMMKKGGSMKKCKYGCK